MPENDNQASPGEKLARVSANLHPDLDAGIRTAAEADGTSYTATLTEAVMLYLAYREALRKKEMPAFVRETPSGAKLIREMLLPSAVIFRERSKRRRRQ